MATVRVYNTHIEVHPYKKGDVPELESMLSGKTLKYNKEYRLCYYIDKVENKLYIPRGVSIPYLNRLFSTMAIPQSKHDPYKHMSKKYDVTVEPKSTIQKNAIDFLTCSGKFATNSKYAQFSLNLDQGDGKTAATVMSIVKLNLRAIVIVHQKKLREQWVEAVSKFTNIPPDRVLSINSSTTINDIMLGKINPDNYEIFCVTHQTLTSYARTNENTKTTKKKVKEKNWCDIAAFFKVINVGIKVIDEVHLFFLKIPSIICPSD